VVHGVRSTSLAVTSDVVRTRRPGGSTRGPATSISCLQVTSTGTWQRRWLPPLRRTSSSSSRRHLQLLRTWNQATRRRQVHLHQRSGRQRRTTPESALCVVMMIRRGGSTKALSPSCRSSTGYSVTPAASGCTTSARALDVPHPLYLCA